MPRGGVKRSFVYYYGCRYGDEKEVFWQNADIFVFPTFYHNECFPLVLLEAMQYGVACISTDEGGISDIIEDGTTGFIVERQNALQLAEKIGRFFDNPLWISSFGDAASKKFKQEFTQTAFENRMRNILTQIIDYYA